jgi:hypothetical protein
MAEGSIKGKIKLVRTYDDESDSFSASPKLESHANMPLLKQLMEEGKIGSFHDKDRSHGPSGHEL